QWRGLGVWWLWWWCWGVYLNTTHPNNNPLKIYLPKKLLECLPKCSSLPKERHRWNTNEYKKKQIFIVEYLHKDLQSYSALVGGKKIHTELKFYS
uniref:Calmodulin binding transcription activator 1 n=1 Tax=Pundamilia nyererei TaxID=303518 RepID=A0A3B4FFC8_9CICH